ncbi:isocitrate lyase/PEP mutase family protein [Cereibacter sp. SYSU M97828]|nr:isocitrate lyase/PEP mutase family protein [Cereibacter flavus]
MHLRKTVVEGRMSAELRRQIAERTGPIVAISGATPHHAQLTEQAGFKLFFHSGSQAAAHIMGLPDAGLMTLTEAVDNIRRICQSVSIPVVADCETGFGNVVNTTRAVHDYITAGVAGFFLEDQTFPKRCGFTKGVEVIPTDEAVAKYRAASARRDALDPDVVIIARTDSRAAVGGSVDEVLRRCEAYIGAGADMLMVMALKSREEIARVAEAFPEVPIYFNTSAVKPALSHAEYAEFNAATYNISISKVSQLMMEGFLRQCRESGADAFNDFMETQKASKHGALSYLDLTGFPSVLEIERNFLTEAELKKYELSEGEYDPRG